MSGLSLPHIFRKKPPPPTVTDLIVEQLHDKYEIPPWIVVGLSYLSTAEVGGKDSNPVIDKFLNYVNLPSDDEIAWCAAAHGYILEESGYKGTKKPNAQSYLNWGRTLDEPKKFCTVVFKRGTEPWQGHVANLLDWYGGYCVVMGGNQSNRYTVAKYKQSDVLGYRWPIVKIKE